MHKLIKMFILEELRLFFLAKVIVPVINFYTKEIAEAGNCAFMPVFICIILSVRFFYLCWKSSIYECIFIKVCC